MNIEVFRSFFLWCTVIDYALLLIWFAVFSLAHDRHYRLTTRWFAISREEYDRLSFIGIAGFKIATIIFNLVPFVSLSLIG